MALGDRGGHILLPPHDFTVLAVLGVFLAALGWFPASLAIALFSLWMVELPLHFEMISRLF